MATFWVSHVVFPNSLSSRTLTKIPMQVRFGIAGAFGNIIFLCLYNFAVNKLDGIYPASTVYMAVYLLFIPVTHAVVSLLVFGWPRNYITSLMSNVPIGE